MRVGTGVRPRPNGCYTRSDQPLVESLVRVLPDSLPRLVGHQWALDAIARQAVSQRRAHAYLVTGPPHVGKFTTGLEIARLFLCAETPACGDCRHCRLAARRAHPDLRILEIPADRKTIPIKDVHDFMQGIALKPLEAALKVYVIRGAEDLSEEGANALLKTIEEPPPGVTLVLTAPSASALLPTIVSRCQTINLRRVPQQDIAEHLIAVHQMEPEQARVLAAASQGLPGWAIIATDKQELLEERHDRARDLLRLLSADRLERIRYADDLGDEWSNHADDVRDVLETWTDVWRAALLAQGGLGSRAVAVTGREDLGAAASILEPEAVQSALASTLELSESLDRNAHPRLALEAYVLHLPRLPAAQRV